MRILGIEVADLLMGIAAGPVQKRAITDSRVLNQACDYPSPSSFSRGMRIDWNGLAIIPISGRAGIDECGQSVPIGDLQAILRRLELLTEIEAIAMFRTDTKPLSDR